MVPSYPVMLLLSDSGLDKAMGKSLGGTCLTACSVLCRMVKFGHSVSELLIQPSQNAPLMWTMKGLQKVTVSILNNNIYWMHAQFNTAFGNGVCGLDVSVFIIVVSSIILLLIVNYHWCCVDVRVGDDLLVDGGMVRFEVIEKIGPDVKCLCTDPGLLLPRANLTFWRDGHLVRERNAMLPTISSKVGASPSLKCHFLG